MGVGIIIKDVYVLGVTKATIESRLADIKTYIGIVRGQLIALTASSPYPVQYDDGEPMDWADYAESRTRSLMDDLIEYETERFLLEYAIENINDVIDD